jgi:hypothetical protein
MVSLRDVGLVEESPTEVILSTFYPDGKLHVSVMGVKAKGKSKVLLRIFTDTDTFSNITRSKGAVIIITRDIELMTNIALRRLLNFDESKLDFRSSRRVNAPILSKADAYVEIEVENIRKTKLLDEIGTSEVAYVTASVKNIKVQNSRICPFRRSESFLIESALLATRIMKAVEGGRDRVAEEKYRKLSEYQRECERIAPGSKDSCLISKITRSLKNQMRR